MKEYDCSCWKHYPNPNHKKRNGTWLCVDKYECVRDLIDGKWWDAKTHCRRRKDERQKPMP